MGGRLTFKEPITSSTPGWVWMGGEVGGTVCTTIVVGASVTGSSVVGAGVWIPVLVHVLPTVGS
jgi:uncharacterized membrane protein YdcZ (DUF606 family)